MDDHVVLPSAVSKLSGGIKLLFYLLLFQWAAGCAWAETVVESVAELDLEEADWGKGKVHRLDGEWLLIYGHFVTPEEVETHLYPPLSEDVVGNGNNSDKTLEYKKGVESVGFVNVPGFWNEAESGYERFGIGTLVVSVKVPANKSLYLALSDIPSAYKLYVNGRLMAQVGEPSTTLQNEVPMFRPMLVDLGKSDGRLQIVLQISNFHYKQIGVRRSIQLTDESGFVYLREAPLLFDVFFCGVLVTIGAILLSRFLRQRNDRASLYLGLFSLMVGSRALLVGERLLYQLEWFSWSGLQKAEHILLYAGLAAFGAYLYELLDGGMSRLFLLILGSVSPSLIALVWWLPVYQGTLTVLPFKLLVAGVALYMLFSYWPLLKQRGAGVFWFGASFIVLLMALLIDFISQNIQFQNRPIVHWGMVLFVVCQTLFLNHVRHWRRRRLKEMNEPSRPEGVVQSLFNELGASRQKIENLEVQLQLLRNDLIPATPELSRADLVQRIPVIIQRKTDKADYFQHAESDARLALVNLLRLSLSLWERYTGKSKVELAEESHCWRVYVDGSTVKTRTFDKYLLLKSLPAKPRWRLVTRSAYFILENVTLPENERSVLEAMIAAVEQDYS